MKLIESLIKKYEAEMAMAEATIEIYMKNSVGIGEHPQHLEEIDKLLGQLAEAKDKLEAAHHMLAKRETLNG